MDIRKFYILCGYILIGVFVFRSTPEKSKEPIAETVVSTSETPEEAFIFSTEESESTEVETVEETPKESEINLRIISEEEFELLALVAMAEAEDESELGKRLVIDTVLNRVDSPYFPDTITDVIYQKHQFTSMWNCRYKQTYVDDYVRNLVKEELQNRTNSDVIFFRMNRYSDYGTPLFKEDGHYFSSY